MNRMDLSQLKWLKNVRHPVEGWAYEKLNEMQIPEAKIFRLHWKSQEDKTAEDPRKGDLMVLVQQAKVTHVVELLDNEVYKTEEEPWGIYRIVKAVGMPTEGFDWSKLPHQREIFGIEDLPPDGSAHDLDRIDRMYQFNHYWQDRGGLNAFQKSLSENLKDFTWKF
jgi:hypothetical protein